jgi:hypothetical protein
MSFPSFFNLLGGWLFLLLIPLVVFYFLKLKRPRLEIPSLALWQQVIQDRRVNSPFQRFKRNLLLLLQILLLLLLVLAVMQPFIQSADDRADMLPVLIDCSASMGALDGPNGQTRLEEAKKEVRKLIDNLLPTQRLSLISFSSTARRLTDFTGNKRVLHAALDKIEVTPVPSKVTDALRMAQALALSAKIETIVVLTDGNIPAQVDFELPFNVNYQRLPAGGANIGITSLNARRADAGVWDVFVRIEGSSAKRMAAKVELVQDGKLVGNEQVVLDSGESQRLVFQVESERPVELEVRMKPVGFDSLESDNVAYLDLPAARPLVTYCSPDLASYRHALMAHKEVALFPNDDGTGALSPDQSADLLIADSVADGAPEATIAVYVGVVPEDVKTLVGVDAGLAEVIDWKRSEPLLQHVQLADVQIGDVPKYGDDVGEEDFEQLGYEVIAHGRLGPLILKKRIGQQQLFYLLFHTDRSTLPYRIGFPILVANVVQIALQQAELSEVRAQPTGLLPEKKYKEESEYRITGPDGRRFSGKTNTEGLLTGIPAPQVGRYTIAEGSKQIDSIGVSLLSADETNLGSVEKIQFRELSVAAAGEKIDSDWPLWSYIAAGALCLLLFEWWYFQRRPGGMPA